MNHVVRQDFLVTVATPPDRGDLVGNVTQVFVKSRIAILLVWWVGTRTPSLIIVIFIQSPWTAPCHDSWSKIKYNEYAENYFFKNLLSKVVIVQVGGITIGVLFNTHVERELVQIDRIILVTIRSADIPMGNIHVIQIIEYSNSSLNNQIGR